MKQSKELFEMLIKCQKQSWRSIITGAWLLPDDDNPEMDGSKISIT